MSRIKPSALHRALAIAALVFSAGTPALAQNKGHEMAPQSQQSPMGAMQQDVSELRGLHGADRERTYLTRMLDHHQSGIDMARLALQRATRPGLRREAHAIIADQTREIGQMRAFLSRFYGINRTAKPDPRMQETMQKLAALSGSAFDRTFAREMIGHHQAAIQMSQAVVGGAPHAPVRRLAAKIARSNRLSQQRLRRSAF